MRLVYLLLGSNIGNREANIMAARNMITEHVGIVDKQSAIYETEPWGGVEQPSFLNQAIAVTTPLTPITLLKELKSIEKAVGRVDTVVWGPRVIDIDIMLMGDTILHSDTLTIPQLRLENRRFALVPLSEIASDIIHPILHVSIQQLLIDCNDTMWVKKWATQ